MDDNTSAIPKAKTAEIRTAEQWAEFRGHLPETKPGVPRQDRPQATVKPIHNLSTALYRGALFTSLEDGGFGGVIGREVTLAQYDAAVKAATDHVFR